jgi:hypothetical protein
LTDYFLNQRLTAIFLKAFMHKPTLAQQSFCPGNSTPMIPSIFLHGQILGRIFNQVVSLCPESHREQALKDIQVRLLHLQHSS